MSDDIHVRPDVVTFMDSGAHGLFNKHVKEVQGPRRYDYYESDDFWEYVDRYAAFIHEHKDLLEVYVNVDVIFRPDLSWKVQKYLEEEHNLNPLPVIHCGTEMKWLKRYMDNYEYLGIGGIGQHISSAQYVRFGDVVFNLLCDNPKRLPRWKTHGFAMTSFILMRRWPWYSVDSTSWVKLGAYGKLLVPRLRNDKWDYSRNPRILDISIKRDTVKKHGAHLRTISPKTFDIVQRYVKEQGFEVGASHFEGEEEVVDEPGVTNQSADRCRLNAMYYMDFAERLPEWPWAFHTREKTKGFGFV